MNSQTIRLVCLAITLPVIAIEASTAGRAQSKSFDGGYKGSLECERQTAGVGGVFRTPLSIVIRESWVTAVFDHDDAPMAIAAGTVDSDGIFRMGYTLYGYDYSTHGDYSGTLNDAGGALTGSRVLTRQNTGDGGTRTCKGTFLKVEPPTQ